MTLQATTIRLRCVPQWMAGQVRVPQVRVEAGDIAIFRQTTPYYGTVNDTNTIRTVFFSILTPFNDAEQDELQVFRWMYIERTYGAESRRTHYTTTGSIFHSNDTMDVRR